QYIDVIWWVLTHGPVHCELLWVGPYLDLCLLGAFNAMMLPRLKKKDLVRERPPTPLYTPSTQPQNTLPTRGGKIPALIFLQRGQALAQNRYLPPRVRPAIDPAPTTHPKEENPFLDYGDVVDLPVSRHC
ncbi:hypothetical protein DXG01_003432, partial [Tephrocybe rancida]